MTNLLRIVTHCRFSYFDMIALAFAVSVYRAVGAAGFILTIIILGFASVYLEGKVREIKP